MSARDLLSEQLAADAAPELGPGVAVPLERGGLRLAAQVVLVLVHAALLLQALTHRVQVYIRRQDARHPESRSTMPLPRENKERGGWVPREAFH